MRKYQRQHRKLFSWLLEEVLRSTWAAEGFPLLAQVLREYVCTKFTLDAMCQGTEMGTQAGGDVSRLDQL